MNCRRGARRPSIPARRGPSWSPTLRFIRAYDPLTGKELWRPGGSSKITAPAPICAGKLILVSSGRRPEAPIFAIRAGAACDITLAGEPTHSASVAWPKMQRGPYMPTPLFYRGMLYVLGNGHFRRLRFQDRARDLPAAHPAPGSGFSASPVVSDGKIELLKTNRMNEPVMATPAISGGTLIVRAQHQVYGIRRK
jgi:hypothetical protein